MCVENVKCILEFIFLFSYSVLHALSKKKSLIFHALYILWSYQENMQSRTDSKIHLSASN